MPLLYFYVFIHFRYLYSALSRFLLRAPPDYSAHTESEFHAEAHEQLRVKDLPRVPTRRLQVDSNPQPSDCKAPNIPLHHRAPLIYIYIYISRREWGGACSSIPGGGLMTLLQAWPVTQSY